MLIKHIPEDFAVEEITNVKKKDKGNYCYFWLEKKNRNTQDAVDAVARALHVRKIGFAGTKDKKAITKQLCSAENVRKESIEKVSVRGVTLTFYGYGDEPVSLGDLKGNKFSIVVRDVDSDIKVKKLKEIVNYFDEQRFSRTNVDVGRAIVKKDFKKAAELIASGEGDYNLKVKEFITRNKTNFIGALHLVPRKILRMIIGSYQSYLWNDTVARLIEGQTKFVRVPYSQGQLAFPTGKIVDRKIPMIGFDTQVDKEIRVIVNEIMHREGITFRDFIIREFPELTMEGAERDMIVPVKKFSAKMVKDELFDGRKKIMLSFELPKGSYATMVVKRLSTQP